MTRMPKLAGSVAILLLSSSLVAAPNSSLASAPVLPERTPTPPLPAQHMTLDKGVRESVSASMARDRQAGPLGVSAVPAPGVQSSRANHPLDPASGRLAATPDRAAPLSTPRLPQTTGVQMQGAQLSDSGLVPPDSMGAVGPTQYIVIVNGRIRSFLKSNGAADAVLDKTTNSFFINRGGSGTSDPRVRYDRLSGRWFFTMITVSTPNLVLIAYSNSSTITGGTIFSFRTFPVGTFHPNCLWDYDTLGIDQNALYIGGNLFCPQFHETRGLVINKAEVLAGIPAHLTDFGLGDNGAGCASNIDGLFTPEGVDNYDPAATVGYFAGTSLCVYGRLTFARITNPSSPMPSGVILRLTVAPTALPVPVAAMGSTYPLDALDDRLFAAHLRNGHLWTAHNFCVDSTGLATPPPAPCPAGARDGARWYDITNLDSTPALNQSGTVFDPAATNPRNYWIPSMMVSGQGHVAMGTSAAGATEHGEAATMGRLAGDAPGTMQAANIYQTSTFDYNAQLSPPPVGNVQRWGDYSYTSLDPNDDMTMWTIQEFTNANNSWGVEAVQLKAPPPATPLSTGPGPNYANECSVTVTVTGTSTAGSGFYDPGRGFANRIQASVSGGVTVNHVTYVDPTHVTLDVSTQGAAPGLKDVTITNPDGQSATGTGILDVQAAAAATGIMSATSTNQYSLSNSDGNTWQEIDPALRLTCAPVANQDVLLTANADLFTGASGYNQDIGIFVNDDRTFTDGSTTSGSPNITSPALAQFTKADEGRSITGSGIPANSTIVSFTSATAVTISQNATLTASGVSMTITGDTLLAWKESGGFAGTYSPNAAYVQFVYPMLSGQSYVFKLKWKTNKPAPGATIYAAAGPGPFPWSHTSLVGKVFPTGSGPNFTYTNIQYHLTSSDGATWQDVDAAIPSRLQTQAIIPAANATAVLGANVDLFTGNAGYNQDIGIFVNEDRTFTDGSTTTGSPAITSPASAQFTKADVGRSITGSGIPANSTIVSFTSATAVTISQNATLTASGVSMTITGDTLVSWKESGGFAGTYSPNAAFVKATYQMTGTHIYIFKMKWKTNKPAPGATIYAGAGPGPFPWSHTSLVEETIPTGTDPYHKESVTQYSLANSNGSMWQPMDTGLDVTVAPGANTNSIVGANVDLFTGAAGFNQDIGIFVNDNGGGDTLLVWKESGGFAGTYSPNAAFAQATYHMLSGHSYVFKLKWKTNKDAPGATIYAAAGPGPTPWSNTRLTVELAH